MGHLVGADDCQLAATGAAPGFGIFVGHPGLFRTGSPQAVLGASPCSWLSGAVFPRGAYHAHEKGLPGAQALSLYRCIAGRADEQICLFQAAHEDYANWITLDGFFWFPRTLFGIENHLLAFYDEPELMLEINQDLADYHKRVVEVVYTRIHPVFMTFGRICPITTALCFPKTIMTGLCFPFTGRLFRF